MSDNPNIWTDGSGEDFSSVGGFEVAGAGVHLPAAEVAFESSVWGVAEEYGDARLERCRAFMPVPGVLQSVRRAIWELITSMLLRQFRLLDWGNLAKQLPLVKDGDLVALAQYMICTRGRDPVRGYQG